jgi:hypothetical protein
MLDAGAVATRRPRRWWIGAIAAAGLAIAIAAIVWAAQKHPPRQGRLATAAVDAVVAEHANELQACHRAALGEQPDLGDVTARIAIVVEPDGHVSSVAIVDAGAPTPTLAGCVTAGILRWTFPPPDGHARVQVEHAFFFEQPPPLEIAVVDGAYQVPRATFERWKREPAWLTTARFVPATRDEVFEGYKLYAIPPGSALAALGFENGDTLLAFNGVRIDNDPVVLLPLVEQISAASRIEVRLLRRGAERTQIYEIVTR